jgi:hypothetical protein
MYPPGAEVVGKKAAEGVWALLRSWFTSKHKLEERIRELEAELAEERSGRLAFERLRGELDCRPENDGMYWKKDGSGGPYCPLCLDADHRLIQLTHGNGEGSFCCPHHDRYFYTEAYRQRHQQAIQNRFQVGRRRSRFGSHS